MASSSDSSGWPGHGVIVWLIGSLLLGGLGCSDDDAGDADAEATVSSPCVDAGAPAPCGLSSPPGGLAFSAAVELPEDDPFGGIAPYALDLYETSEGQAIGVFSRPAGSTSPAPGDAQPIGEVGPEGLEGVQLQVGGTEHLVAARDMSEGELIELATAAFDGADAGESGGGADPVLGERQAHQEVSWVPGLGSLPLPTTVPAFVLSYTSSASDPDGEQRSVAMATIAGSADDVDVLAWWFDGSPPDGSTATFRSPAYATPEGVPAPEAVFTVELGEHGVLLIVRSAGLSRGQHTGLLDATTALAPDEWDRLVEQTRSSSATETSLETTGS